MFVIVCLCLFKIQRVEGALMQPQTPKDAKLQRGTNDDQRSELWGRLTWPRIVLGSLADMMLPKLSRSLEARTVFFAEHAHKS